ncbi:hypothetical protein PR202_ga17937 [Eleusine coracana subsp. coracana]|uniref:Uncharacterized protein n=1 Tax=Eleusine coracana subsp. coracana TaxID=191504 RepID=A0AAV5CRV7_ELECO|nr:hypothetical protein PR202_ga17937 [Eleusine coracana subsp. coracana]
MASEDSKDILKNVDWKTVGGSVTTETSQPIVKKRLPKKIRQVPDCYFLPRRSWPSALAFYGAVCAAGVGAGMVLEVWINKKIKGTFLISWHKRTGHLNFLSENNVYSSKNEIMTCTL